MRYFPLPFLLILYIDDSHLTYRNMPQPKDYIQTLDEYSFFHKRKCCNKVFNKEIIVFKVTQNNEIDDNILVQRLAVVCF